MYAFNFRDAVAKPRGFQQIRKVARDGLLWARSLVADQSGPPALRLLYCHYVFDDQRRDFATLIESLQRIGDFVRTDDVVDIIEGQRPVTRNLFHLSFDDGFRNVITNAFPILAERGISAIFFVPTAIISADGGAAESYCRGTLKYSSTIELANWDDLARARAAGFDVGSHTRTHTRFKHISASSAAVEDEIAGSKADLEKHLGVGDYISWPYGRIGDADLPSLKAVERAGYRACFGAFRGKIVPNETDKYRIPRHHFEVQWPLRHVTYFARGAMEG